MKYSKVLAIAAALFSSPLHAEEVKIGELHPITGPLSFFGLPMSRAMQLAVEQINTTGGIDVSGTKYTIGLLTGDTQANPTIGVAALKKLTAEGATYLVGPLHGAVAPALKPIVERDESLTLIVDGATPDGLPTGKNIFRNQTTVQGFTKPIITHAGDKKIKTIAFITDRYHTAQISSEEADIASFSAVGTEVVAREYMKLGDTDFSAQLTKIVAAKPESILFRTYPNEAALMTKQARQLGYEGTIIWVVLAPPATVLKNISSAEMEGVLNGYPPAAEDLAKLGEVNAKAFVEAYKAKFGDAPGELSALSYDAVYIIKAAIEKAGSIDNKVVNQVLAGIQLSEIPELVNVYKAQPDGRLFNNAGQADFQGVVHVWKDGHWVPLSAASN